MISSNFIKIYSFKKINVHDVCKCPEHDVITRLNDSKNVHVSPSVLVFKYGRFCWPDYLWSLFDDYSLHLSLLPSPTFIVLHGEVSYVRVHTLTLLSRNELQNINSLCKQASTQNRGRLVGILAGYAGTHAKPCQ